MKEDTKQRAREMNAIEEFLNKTASTVNAGLDHLHQVNIVLGNEAADLDSIVSSLLFAYLQAGMCKDSVWIPVVAVPREDMLLRPDCITFFEGLVSFDCMFYSDFLQLVEPYLSRSSSNISTSASTNKADNISQDWCLTLTDHNVLAPSLAHLQGRVTAIIDHHVDSGLSLEASPRMIKTVGSATSLVILHFYDYISTQLSTEERRRVGQLAIGPITVDTGGFKPKKGRTTPSDERAAQYCWQWMSPSAQSSSIATENDPQREAYCKRLHKKLRKARQRIDHFSSSDLLRKDYKEYNNPKELNSGMRYGMSSVSWNFDEWVAREGGKDGINVGRQRLQKSIQEYVRQRGINYLLVLTSFKRDNGDHAREMGGIAPISFWQNLSTEKELQMTLRWSVSEEENSLRVYEVGNAEMSRKCSQPIIHDIFFGEQD